jgi:hypothetical protein
VGRVDKDDASPTRAEETSQYSESLGAHERCSHR